MSSLLAGNSSSSYGPSISMPPCDRIMTIMSAIDMLARIRRLSVNRSRASLAAGDPSMAMIASNV